MTLCFIFPNLGWSYETAHFFHEITPFCEFKTYLIWSVRIINIRLLSYDNVTIPCNSVNNNFVNGSLSNCGCTLFAMVYPMWYGIYKWVWWFKWKIKPIDNSRLRFRHSLCCVTSHPLSGIIYSGNICCREYQWMFSVNLWMRILWSSCPGKPTIVYVYWTHFFSIAYHGWFIFPYDVPPPPPCC